MGLRHLKLKRKYSQKLRLRSLGEIGNREKRREDRLILARRAVMPDRCHGHFSHILD